MGASLLSLLPGAAALREAGRPALAIPATEVLEPGGGRVGRAYVAVSQSGESTETVDAFADLSAPRLALTNAGGNPLAGVADLALPIGSEEDVGISVMTYTASLWSVAALVCRLGAREVDLDADSIGRMVHRAIEDFDPMSDRFAERLDDIRAVDVVGGSPSVGSAAYAALAMREAARTPTAWFETRQYLHGPIEAAEGGLAAIVFGSGREVQLALDLVSYGLTVLLVTDLADVPRSDGSALTVFRHPSVPPVIAPILHAVPGQLVAEAMARRRGISPGVFRHHQADTKVARG
jgi:glucosamine--fructose-6-phosphate aminotransferase (isomerizing)